MTSTGLRTGGPTSNVPDADKCRAVQPVRICSGVKLRGARKVYPADRHFDADTQLYWCGSVPHVVEVVVDMRLAEAHARYPLPNTLEQIVMQRDSQLAAIGRGTVRN